MRLIVSHDEPTFYEFLQLNEHRWTGSYYIASGRELLQSERAGKEVDFTGQDAVTNHR